MHNLFTLLVLVALFCGYAIDSRAQSDHIDTASTPSIDIRDSSYSNVDKLPQFKGGQEAISQYINTNLVYPTMALDLDIEGTVMVEFVIRKDGIIDEVHAVESPHPILSAEAEKIIRNMPAWIPGEKDGRVVNVKYQVPVTFRLKRDFIADKKKSRSKKPLTDVGTETNYRTVDKMPVFPGGTNALKQYFSDNLNYPLSAIERNIQGTVMVEFLVNKSGFISDVKTLSAPDSVLAMEAKRVIYHMPKWKPGEIDGKAVNTYYKLPVVFRLKEMADPPNVFPDSIEAIATPPSFPGGIEALAAYLSNAVLYPLVAIDENIQGTVMVAFTVNADGSIDNVTALNQLNGGCTEEAIRVVKEMPHWIPAENLLGQKVASSFRIPVTFELKYSSGDIEVTPLSLQSKPPEFPGGIEAYNAFAKKYLNYPNFARKNNIYGIVILSFIIDSSGNIINVQALRSPDPILTKEAIRLVKLMPQWIPAEDLKGKKVASLVRLPITFRLTE
jgi:TonB family protein